VSKFIRIISVLVAVAILVAVGSSLVSAQAPQQLQARLSGSAINGETPGGQAEWSQSHSGIQRISIEVEDVNLPNGTVLSVSACGADIGSITLADGSGELELNSQNGATVPTCAAGDPVTVANGGTTILTGTLQAKGESEKGQEQGDD